MKERLTRNCRLKYTNHYFEEKNVSYISNHFFNETVVHEMKNIINLSHHK